MQIGSLFLELGIRNADKTVGSLSSIEKGIQNTAHMSLEAKAAIVGMAYALEQLFQASGAQGTSLVNFSTLLGTGTQTLQQYQYAARQVGVSNQEVEQTFKHLSQAAAEQRLLGKAPAFYGMVASKIGGFTGADLQTLEKNPEKYLQYLQKFVDAEKNVGTRNAVLRSFGLSDNMIAAMVKHQFRPEMLGKAPTYSEGEVERLNRANIAWANLNNRVQMAVGHFNALHGAQLQHDIEILVNIGLRLASILLDVADKTKFFETLDKGFQKLDAFAKKVLPQIPMYINQADKAFHELLDLLNRFSNSGKVFDGIKDTTYSIIDNIRTLTTVFVPFLNQLRTIGGNVFDQIQPAIRNAISVFEQFGQVLLGIGEKTHFFDVFETYISNMAKNIESAFGFVSSVVGNLFSSISNLIGLFVELGTAIGNAFGKYISFDEIAKGVEQITTIISNLIGIVASLGTIISNVTSSIVNAVIKVGEVFVKVAEYFHLFDAVASVISGMVKDVETVLGFVEKLTGGAKNALGAVAESTNAPAVENKQVDAVKKFVLDKLGVLLPEKTPENTPQTESLKPSAPLSSNQPLLKLVPPLPTTPSAADIATPNAPASVVNNGGQKINNFNLSQTLNFDLAKEEAKIVNDVKKAVNDAFRQLSSQIQGS